jgi:hypothetical protein
MLAALAGLGPVACAEPAEDQDGSRPLVEHEEPSCDAGLPDPDPDPDPDAGPPESCADQGNFDPDVFATEIFPILNGDIDLNDPDSDQVLTGCTRGPCHGQQRPGSLTLDDSRPLEESLGSFACYVDLARPKRSQVIVCPSGDERCATFPHPGADLLLPGDLNRERILDYIRDSRP